MVQRYNPDYVMHAARFAPFAREAEHGEFVKFSEYEALVSELASSRQINAQTLQVKLTMAETIKELTVRVNALAVENAALKSSVDLIVSAYTEGDLHKTAMALCSVKPDNTAPGAYAGLARSFAAELREAK